MSHLPVKAIIYDLHIEILSSDVIQGHKENKKNVIKYIFFDYDLIFSTIPSILENQLFIFIFRNEQKCFYLV
jgi:hypothetical protein